MKSFRKFSRSNYVAQQGFTLIVVIVVLLALTLAGLASTDSGNLQRLMVRNNQFRLETFNVAFSEIEAQLQNYDADVQAVFSALDAGGLRLSNKDANLQLRTKNYLFDADVGLRDRGDCPIFEETIDITFYKCNLFLIDSNFQYRESGIGSSQRQTFTYYTLR